MTILNLDVNLKHCGSAGSSPVEQVEFIDASEVSKLLNEISVTIISSLIVEHILEVMPMIAIILGLVLVVSLIGRTPHIYITKALI